MGGGGGFLSGLFGGGSSSPDPVQYDPVPVREEAKEPEAKAVRDNERRKTAARRGMSGTILTSPLGVSGQGGSRLLGRSLGQ